MLGSVTERVTTMGWSIDVDAPKGMPDVQEPIISVSSCSGNFYVAVREMKEKQLREMNPDEAIEALIDVINEVDKGNEGRFNNDYAVASDKQWSEGRETLKGWNEVKQYLHRGSFPYKTYEEYCGHEMRKRIREASVRFLLYYKAGYQIAYTW